MKSSIQTWQNAWLSFWFDLKGQESNHRLMCFSLGLVLLYVLALRTYDLEFLFDHEELTGEGFLPFWIQPFSWLRSFGWWWFVHGVAIFCTLAWSLNFYPLYTGAASFWLFLSSISLGVRTTLPLDVLLAFGLGYLWLMQLLFLEENLNKREDSFRLSSLLFRWLQLALALFYFQSGLGEINPFWIEGIAFWHPGFLVSERPLMHALGEDFPQLVRIVPLVILLFDLFYGVLIWVSRLRMPLLVVAVVIHLGVGWQWEKLTYNFVFLIFNMAFLPRQYSQWIVDRWQGLKRFFWVYTF